MADTKASSIVRLLFSHGIHVSELLDGRRIGALQRKKIILQCPIQINNGYRIFAKPTSCENTKKKKIIEIKKEYNIIIIITKYPSPFIPIQYIIYIYLRVPYLYYIKHPQNLCGVRVTECVEKKYLVHQAITICACVCAMCVCGVGAIISRLIYYDNLIMAKDVCACMEVCLLDSLWTGRIAQCRT